jgi:hypothetical protein
VEHPVREQLFACRGSALPDHSNAMMRLAEVPSNTPLERTGGEPFAIERNAASAPAAQRPVVRPQDCGCNSTNKENT